MGNAVVSVCSEVFPVVVDHSEETFALVLFLGVQVAIRHAVSLNFSTSILMA